jgi:hypothetical protein
MSAQMPPEGERPNPPVDPPVPAGPPADQPQPKRVSRRRFVLGVSALVAIVSVPGLLRLWRHGRRPRLEVVINGPFEDDQAKDFGPVDSKFVEPIHLAVRKKENRTDFRVNFAFKGEEKASRVIEMKFTALDANGKVLASETRKVHDPRPAARKPVPMGTLEGILTSDCLETVRVPQTEAEKVKTIKVTFVEL